MKDLLRKAALLFMAVAVIGACSKDSSDGDGGDDDDDPTYYTVEFNTDGGTTIDSQEVEEGTTATCPDDPEKDGYIFEGWYSDSSMESEYDFDAAVNDDLTIYANYIEDIYDAKIYSYTDLTAFRESIAADPTYKAILMADIDMDDYLSWTPIGTDEARFKGTFNGFGHKISNLTIDTTEEYQGLFGYAESCTITDLTIENPNITGGSFTGAIVGYIENGATDSVIDNCAVIGGSVTSTEGGYSYACVGGIAGCVDYATITNCYNTAAINSDNNYVGGITGYAYCATSITDCYNAGVITTLTTGSADYIGGIAGYCGENSLISNCYNTGELVCTTELYNYHCEYVGGIAGYVEDESSIIECYNTAKIIADFSVGGIAGNVEDESSIIDCYNTGSIENGSSYVGGVVGEMSDYSTLSGCYNTGSISCDDEYVGGVAGNLDSSTATECYNTGSVESTTSGSNQIGGVAGCIFKSTMTKCYNTGSVVGYGDAVGGVVGKSSSYPTSLVACYNTGSVYGDYQYIGGVVGAAYTSDNSDVFAACYNTGSVTGSATAEYVGGAIGYVSSNTTAPVISSLYTSGAVSGGQPYVGDTYGGVSNIATVFDGIDITYFSADAASSLNAVVSTLNDAANTALGTSGEIYFTEGSPASTYLPSVMGEALTVQ